VVDADPAVAQYEVQPDGAFQVNPVSNGVSVELVFINVFTEAGIIPGIKVDAGAKDMAGHPGEKITEGLDDLRERLTQYAQIGARFAKWRAVTVIDDGLPTRGCIEANAHALARYARCARKPDWCRSSSRKC
jgi:fructose-bisphosphate aldolase class 1